MASELAKENASAFPPKRKIQLATLAMAMVALCWGTSFAIIKDISSNIPPFTLMALRFGLSTLILGAVFGHRLRRVSLRQTGRSSIIGLALTLAFTALTLGIRYTTASKQSFLVGACVIFVPFLAWIIRGLRPNRNALLGALLATFGIGLLTLDGTFSINKGDLLSILCSLAFAGHMVAIEKLGREVDPIASTLIQFMVGTLGFLLMMGFFESYRFHLSLKEWIAILYLSLFTTVLAFAVQNIAQRHLSATRTSLILTLEPAFGGVFAVIYLGEQLSLKIYLGCLVILAGIITEQTRWRILPWKFNQ